MFNVEHSLSVNLLSQEILLFSLVRFGEICDESHEVLGFQRFLQKVRRDISRGGGEKTEKGGG